MAIKPKFNRDCPPNWQEFFRKESDDEFKKEHPVAYPLFVILGLIVLLAPMVLFIIYIDAASGEPNLLTVILGFIGGLTMGVGLFNIVAAFLGQYLGHKVTMNGILWGAAILILGAYLA